MGLKGVKDKTDLLDRETFNFLWTYGIHDKLCARTDASTHENYAVKHGMIDLVVEGISQFVM
jgi:hypothetical protein